MKVPCLSGDGGELVGEIYCNEVIDDFVEKYESPNNYYFLYPYSTIAHTSRVYKPNVEGNPVSEKVKAVNPNDLNLTN